MRPPNEFGRAPWKNGNEDGAETGRGEQLNKRLARQRDLADG